MSGQPQIVGFWQFNIADVDAVEVGGVAPSIIVNAGQNFNLRITLTLNGFGASAGIAEWFDNPAGTQGAKIEHFALNLETGSVKVLPYKIPSGQPGLVEGVNYLVTTGPYTTGAGNDLDLGTYQITTCLRLTSPDLSGVEAGFHVSNLMVVVKPPLP